MVLINCVLKIIVTNLFLLFEKTKGKLFFFLIKKSPERESALSEESQMTIAQSSVACEIPVKPDR